MALSLTKCTSKYKIVTNTMKYCATRVRERDDEKKNKVSIYEYLHTYVQVCLWKNK